MLRPLYTNRATQVLLVGPPSSGKRTLAKQLMRSPKIFFSTHILDEMDMSCFDRLVDMDYVLIFVDMTNTLSLKLLEDTFAYMEPEYLLYKCAIVFTKVDMVNLWMLDEDHVRHIIEQHGSPYTFYMNLQDELLRENICEQITRAICIGTFQQRQVHPLGVRLLNNRDFNNAFNNNDTSHADNDYYGQEDQKEHGQSQHEEDQKENGQSQHEEDQKENGQSQHEEDQNENGQSQHEEDQDEYGQSQHEEDQSGYGQSQHEEDQNEHGQSQHEENQDDYGQSQHEEDQSGYGQSQHEEDQNEHGQSQHEENQDDYRQSQHEEDQSGYGQSQHDEDQDDYGQSQYGDELDSQGSRPI